MEIYAEEFGKRGYYLDKQIDNEWVSIISKSIKLITCMGQKK
jgi:hypothetical protein